MSTTCLYKMEVIQKPKYEKKKKNKEYSACTCL